MAAPSAAGNLIVGCGYLGQRVAAAWRARGVPVAALTRSRAAEFAALGLTPIVGDVLDPTSLHRLPAVANVLYAVGLDRSAGRSMREVYVEGLANVLRAVQCEGRIVSVSSTSVYGQTDGEWVDESSPTVPIDESGRVVLDAEQTLRQLRPDAVILRFSGIYGPHRILRKASLLQGEPLVTDAEKWLNLIHVDDGVTAVLAALEHGQPGQTYLISDGEPVTRRMFYTRSAEVLQAPPARFVTGPNLREGNRRIRNAKACRELHWQPRYPSYREGLAASVEAEGTGARISSTSTAG